MTLIMHDTYNAWQRGTNEWGSAVEAVELVVVSGIQGLCCDRTIINSNKRLVPSKIQSDSKIKRDHCSWSLQKKKRNIREHRKAWKLTKLSGGPLVILHQEVGVDLPNLHCTKTALNGQNPKTHRLASWLAHCAAWPEMPLAYCLALLGSSFSNRPAGNLLVSSDARNRQVDSTRASRSSSSTCTSCLNVCMW